MRLLPIYFALNELPAKIKCRFVLSFVTIRHSILILLLFDVFGFIFSLTINQENLLVIRKTTTESANFHKNTILCAGNTL